jgi:hypothetical protein
MTKASDNVFPRLLVSEGGSTATPASGNVTVYAKADGLLYSKDDAGTETLVSGAAGGSGALTLLSTQTVTGSDSTITFSSISGAYNDLVIVGRIRDDAAAVVVAQGLQMVVGNGSVDTAGTSYAWQAYEVQANGSVTAAADNSDGKALLARVVNADSATAGMYTTFNLEITDYADTSVARSYICTYSVPNGSDSRTGAASGAWINTSSAIDIITLQGASGGNFKVGSKARLYGRL